MILVLAGAAILAVLVFQHMRAHSYEMQQRIFDREFQIIKDNYYA